MLEPVKNRKQYSMNLNDEVRLQVGIKQRMIHSYKQNSKSIKDSTDNKLSMASERPMSAHNALKTSMGHHSPVAKK